MGDVVPGAGKTSRLCLEVRIRAPTSDSRCLLSHATAYVGALGLAGAAMAGGLAMILTRWIVFLWPGRRYRLDACNGVAAVPIGLVFLVLGLATALGVLAHLRGMSLGQIRDPLLDRPWRALVPMGLFMLANGTAMVIGFEEGRDRQRGSLWNLLTSIPGRLSGLIGCALGGIVLVIGGYELLQPRAFDDFIAPFSHGWPWKLCL